LTLGLVVIAACPNHPDDCGAMNRLDPRSPLVLDTKDVGRRPGSMAELGRTVEAPADLGTDVISVREGQPIVLDLRLESVVEGVLVTGSATATATGACVRCLEPVEETLVVPFQELFAYADRAAHHREVGADDEGTEEPRLVVDDLIDLEPLLVDSVVPALPFQPVCRVDCPGLCSECGMPLAEDPDHHHDVIDPRWSALAGLAGSPSDEEKRK
jgi:uncharacterized protein